MAETLAENKDKLFALFATVTDRRFRRDYLHPRDGPSERRRAPLIGSRKRFTRGLFSSHLGQVYAEIGPRDLAPKHAEFLHENCDLDRRAVAGANKAAERTKN